MSVTNHPRFLSECLIQDPHRQAGLPDDEIFGVYISWCLLNGEEVGSNKSLWAEMRRLGHAQPHRSGRQHSWAGVTMTGPAAVDYILSSQPSLL